MADSRSLAAALRAGSARQASTPAARSGSWSQRAAGSPVSINPATGRSRLDIKSSRTSRQKAPEKPRSFLQQINPIPLAQQGVQGLGYLFKEAVMAPVHAGTAGVDLARAAGLPIPGESRMNWDGNFVQDIQASYRAYTPLLADIAGSARKTANVTGIGAEKNIIGRYQQAVEEGRWVDAMLEDVGNAALIAGGTGAVLGRTAGATALPGRAAAITRNASATRSIARQVARDSARPGRSGAARRGAQLPPALEYPKSIPTVSTAPGNGGYARAALNIIDEFPEMKQTGVAEQRGRGLAGIIERAELGSDLSPAQIAARGRTVPQRPSLLGKDRPARIVSGSDTAQSVADAGAAASKFGLTAQYADPADALLGIYGNAAKRVTPRFVKNAARRAVANSDLAVKAQSALTQARNEAELYSATRDAAAEVEQAAIRFQYFVDSSLERLGMDEPTRNLHGGLIADAADLTLDTVADAWADLQNKSPRVRGAVLQEWNALRPEWAQLTPERLDLYNDYRNGKLSPEVTEVLDEGLYRLRDAEYQRRSAQLATGNLRMESVNVPTRKGDNKPYNELTPAELRDAVANDLIEYPWRPTKLDPKLDALNETVASRQLDVDAARTTADTAARRLGPEVALRNAMPEPGMEVPYVNTLEGRAQRIAEIDDRLVELQARIDEATKVGETNAEMAEYKAMLNETIQELEADRAALEAQADTRTPTVVGGKSTFNSQVEQIRETAEELQQQNIADADDAFAADFGSVEVVLERPGPTRTQATAMNADLVGDVVAEQAARNVAQDARGNTRIEWYKKDSPIWKGRAKSREWYIKNGYIVPAAGEALDGAGSGVTTHALAEMHRDSVGNSTLSDMAAVNRYFDLVDDRIRARETRLADDALVEQIATRMGTSDLEAVRLALTNKKAYEAHVRRIAKADLEDVTTALGELDDTDRAAIVEMIRDEPENMATFIDDVVQDVTGVTTRYAESLTLLNADMVATWIENQGGMTAAQKAAADAELIQAISDAMDELNAADSRINTDMDVDGTVRRSLDEAAGLEATRPDAVLGTNPSPPDLDSGGTANQGVTRRSLVVDNPEPINKVYERSGRDQTIESETLARNEWRAAEREAWQAERALESAKREAEDFVNEINRSQQDMLMETSRKGVAGIAREAERVNSSGRDLGGYDPNGQSDVPGNPSVGRLTGLVGSVADRLGLRREIAAAVDKIYERQFRVDYEKYVEKNRMEMPEADFDVWLGQHPFGRYVDNRVRLDPKTKAGRVNIAFNELALRADALEDPALKKAWNDARGELEEALVADDLSRSMEPYYADNMMGAHVAWRAMRARIDSLPPSLRKRVSRDVEVAIEGAYKKYRERFLGELTATIDRHMTYVPARFRSLLQGGRRTVAGILKTADEEFGKGNYDVAEALEKTYRHMPTSFAMYVEMGGDVPTHLIAGNGTRQPGARALVNKNAPAEVTVRRVMAGSERTEGIRVNTLREYAAIEAREMTNIAAQQGVMKLATDPAFSKAANEVDGVAQAVIKWKDERGSKPMPFEEFQRILSEQGYAVVKGATEDSMPGWNGRMKKIETNQPARGDIADIPGDPTSMVVLTDPQTGQPIVREFDTIDDMHRLPHIRVVPNYIADVLSDVLNPTSSKWLLMYDQMVQLWKTATLAWSVAWVTYNAIGNAAMATFSYGQSPVTLVKNMNQIRTELRIINEKAGFGGSKPLRTAMKNDTLSQMIPTRMSAHGPTWSERLATQQLSQADTKLGRALETVSSTDNVVGRITNFSYQLNEFTDNMFRTSVLMDDLHKRLAREAPIPPELLNNNGVLRQDLTPAEQRQLTALNKSAEKALVDSTRAALNTMGDFTRLTPAERKVVKRVFPFYQWMRHQTAMSFRLPMQNPMRWAWMASLNDLLADPEHGDAMQALMSRYLTTPFGEIGLAPANPFGQGLTALGGGGSSIFDPRTAFAAASPVAKFPLEMVTGIDMDQMPSPTSRPASQNSTNDVGQVERASAASRIFGGDLLGGLGEIGYNALGTVGQTRAARDLVLGAKPRYDSGNTIDYADDRPGGRFMNIPRGLRVPFVPTDIDFRVEVAEERDKQQARDNRRYSLRQAARSGG